MKRKKSNAYPFLILLFLTTSLSIQSYCQIDESESFIRASMYAVPVDSMSGSGLTLIKWNSEPNITSNVCVKVKIESSSNLGYGALFSTLTSSQKEAPWIQENKSYIFSLLHFNGSDTIRLDSVVVRGIKPIEPGIGVSCFSLAHAYTSTHLDWRYGDCPQLDLVTKAMAKKAMSDISERGFKQVRVVIGGWRNHEEDMLPYFEDEDQYWSDMDTLFNDMDSLHLKMIPVLLHEYRYFSRYFGETNRMMMFDSTSVSYHVVRNFITKFSTRYKDHPALLFYDLTGEWNSRTDIDIFSFEEANSNIDNFDVENFTSVELRFFLEEICDRIRSNDLNHMISSGFALARKQAYHLLQTPYGAPSGPDFTVDSREEFEWYMDYILAPFDLVTAHIYNSSNNHHLRWEMSDNISQNNEDPIYSAAMIDTMMVLADNLGKVFYLGEYGDANPLITIDTAALFTHDALRRIEELKVPYSTIFVWELYNNFVDRPMKYNIEPGYNEKLIERLIDVNSSFGNNPPYTGGLDTLPPRIILTYPFKNCQDSPSETLYAVASDLSGIEKVDFYFNDFLINSDSLPPYTMDFELGTPATIVAVATDKSGNENRWTKVFTACCLPTGAPCDDGNPDTTDDIVNEDCICAGNEITSNNDLNITAEFNVFPNPFSNELTIEGDLKSTSIKIFNTIGKIVYSSQNNNRNKTIDLQYLPEGIYFVTIKKNNSLWHFKTVKCYSY